MILRLSARLSPLLVAAALFLIGPATVQAQLFQPQVTYPAGSGAGFSATADFNGDGNLDIVNPNPNDGTYTVYMGVGDGTFTPSALNLATLGTPQRLAVGDFNGDGFMDFVAANTANTAVFLGIGDGTFQPPVTYNDGGDSNAVAVGDVNNDGDLDLVVSLSNDTLRVFTGDGTGAFSPGGVFPFFAPLGSRVADLNGDGFLDIVVASSSANAVGTLLGNGTGLFSPAVMYLAGNLPLDVATGDLNGDGSPDFVASNLGSSFFHVFLNAGGGVFTPQPAVATADGSAGVSLADFNGDGNLDVVAANTLVNLVTFHAGNGDGSFQPYESHPTGSFPVPVIAGDFNNDGWLDLSVSNQLDDTLGILLNRSQDITFTPIPTPQVRSANFVNVVAAASSGLPVTFSIVSGPATVAGSQVTFTGVGDVVVRASQAGDLDHNAALPVDRTFRIDPVPTAPVLFKLAPDGNANPTRLAYFDSAGRYSVAASFTRLRNGRIGGPKTFTVTNGINIGTDIFFSRTGFPDRVFNTDGYRARFFRNRDGSARVIGAGPHRPGINRVVRNFVRQYQAALGPLNASLAAMRATDFTDPAVAGGSGRPVVVGTVAGISGVSQLTLEILSRAIVRRPGAPEARLFGVTITALRAARATAAASLGDATLCRPITANDGLTAAQITNFILTAARGESYAGFSVRAWFRTKRPHIAEAYISGYTLAAYYQAHFGTPTPLE